ncbi:DNA topoisomerase 1 [Camellia lanceoleosa]|nr:DNA topoisomerase 1 [Camellia lanceoleosa]
MHSNCFKQGAIFRAAAAVISMSVEQSLNTRWRNKLLNEAQATMEVGKILGLDFEGLTIVAGSELVCLCLHIARFRVWYAMFCAAFDLWAVGLHCVDVSKSALSWNWKGSVEVGFCISAFCCKDEGDEDDDEADTVGCCTLKVENVEPMPLNILKFDFLGKDSIRYQNEVEVQLPAFKTIQQFRIGKSGGDDLFDKLDTNKLNAHLKELMPGLIAKVFRTYNASITLDEMVRGKLGFFTP